MVNVLRAAGGVVAGLLVAFLLVIAVELFSSVVHPLPPDFGGTTEEMSAHVERYPAWVLAVVVPIWAVTAFVGTWIAGKLGNRSSALVVGLLLVAALAFNVAMLPYPVWFKVACLAGDSAERGGRTLLVAPAQNECQPNVRHAMVKTYGLTHIALAVTDMERSLRFYQQVFGVEAYFRDEESIHVRTPGCHDVLTFVRKDAPATSGGGVIHFGFRLQSPMDIDQAVAEVEAAGGTLLRRGEFSLGYPYAYVADPDGYEVEIWFE